MTDADQLANRNAQIVARVRAGESYRSIGRSLGISAARVGAIIADAAPDAVQEGAQVRARRRPEPVQRPTVRKKDPICGRRFTTTDLRRRTCGRPECAAEWRRRRLQLDPDLNRRHQIGVAKHVLRNPGRYDPSMERHARKLLDQAGEQAPEASAA
jgi:hypothetical protein